MEARKLEVQQGSLGCFPPAPASSPATSTERQQRQCRVYYRYLVEQWMALLILVQVTVLFLPRFSDAAMSTRLAREEA
jgi:hypothetical protein